MNQLLIRMFFTHSLRHLREVYNPVISLKSDLNATISQNLTPNTEK